MATRKTTKSKSRKSKAQNSANTNSQTRASSESSRGASKSAFNFADITKNFGDTSKFWNFGNKANFQPANFQALIEQVMETSQKNMEAVTACTQLYVEHAKGSIEDYAAFAGKLLQETASTVQGSLNNTKSDPRNKLEDISEFAKYCLDKTSSHARKATEESLEIANKISTTLNKRLSATVDELRDAA